MLKIKILFHMEIKENIYLCSISVQLCFVTNLFTSCYNIDFFFFTFSLVYLFTGWLVLSLMFTLRMYGEHLFVFVFRSFYPENELFKCLCTH